MAREEREKESRNYNPGLYGPWHAPDSDVVPDIEEQDFVEYLRRNLDHSAEHVSPFPGSHWSYARHDSTYDEEGFTQGHTGKGPKGWRLSDEKIHEKVCDALYMSPDVDASDIEVVVLNGNVSLIGYVDSRQAKRLAERAVENIIGVWDVRNELRIRKKN